MDGTILLTGSVLVAGFTFYRSFEGKSSWLRKTVLVHTLAPYNYDISNGGQRLMRVRIREKGTFAYVGTVRLRSYRLLQQ